MKSPSLPLAAIALALVLALTACGSSGSTTTTKSKSTPSTPAKTASVTLISDKREPSVGVVLVDSQGRTLYQFLPDAAKHVTCTGSCATVWPPLMLRSGTKLSASGGVKASLLGSDANPGGGRVVTYAGWPLYTYVADASPGRHTGEGVNLNGGLWYVMSPEGKAVK